MGCAHTVSSGSLNEAHSFAEAVKVIDDYQLCVASRAPRSGVYIWGGSVRAADRQTAAARGHLPAGRAGRSGAS